MPCSGEHMNPTTLERDLSRVAYLLDELDLMPFTSEQYAAGMHPAVYGRADNALRDKLVSDLCNRLHLVRDVTQYSLEMQTWWRDHQAADAARKAKATLAEDGQESILLAQPRSATFAPKMIPVTGIEAEVCADIARRQQMGVKKYGTTLADNPAGEIERLQHAYEETLDLANYLKWQIVRKKADL